MAEVDFPRVLIADDAPAVVQRVVEMIEKSGRFVVAGTAADGGEALALYGKYGPCTLILDLNMPVMTGLELVRRLRADGHECIIYIMTSNADPDTMAVCLSAGANRFFDKITQFEQIVAALIADHPDTKTS